MSKLREKLTASEVLRRYAEGRKDFRGTNLRGQSFKGKDLKGADFSEADIRGANFKNATLSKTKFCNAKAGLQKQWAFNLVIVLFVVSVLSGVVASVPSGWAAYLFLPQNFKYTSEFTTVILVIGLVNLMVFTVVFLISTFQSFVTRTLVAVLITTVALASAAVLEEAIDLLDLKEIPIAEEGLWVLAVIIAEEGLWVLAAIIALAVVVETVVALVGAVTRIVADKIIWMVVEAGAVTGAVGSIVLWAILRRWILEKVEVLPTVIAVVIALSVTGLGVYISWRAIKEDPRDAWIRNIAINFAATGGTSFYNADLTDADFTGATLKSTDLREANLTRTCWRNTKKLDLVRSGTSYLQDKNVRQLLITGEGQDKKFERLDLRGLNLKGANLGNASFIDTDLYQANLQEANLFGAKLVRANLERVDLTGASLTGACIQDWSVTRSTKLYGVECKYVFMKFVDGDKRDQMPPKGEFKDDEFIFFVRSILDTLDLYHEQDVNPRAAVIVLRSLVDDYQEPLEIVGLEKRGNGIIIKLKTSEFANQEQLKEEYYARYSQTLTLSLADPSKMLPQYEVLEARFTELVEEVKQRPTTSIKYLYNEGLFVTGGSPSVNIEQGRNQYINTEGGGIGNIGENRGTAIGNQTNYTSNQNLAEAAAEIQQLLEQLSQTYPTTTTTEQMVVATKAIERIESNPDWKQRAVNALKQGSLKALENHPVGAFIVGAIKDWQNSE